MSPVEVDARLSTRKVVTPPTTLYLEMTQLGIVSDLSVQLAVGQTGVSGMSMARAAPATQRALVRNIVLTIVNQVNNHNSIVGNGR